MKVSCLCPTFGRVHLLEESIQCFLDQDYLDRELIILNDYAQQTLVFDHPMVKIVNVKDRYKTLGDKRNATVALATGEVLVTWDDDDIHLPGRITRLLMTWDKRVSVVLEGCFLLMDRSTITKKDGSHGGAWLVSASAVEGVGGYKALNVYEDKILISDIINKYGADTVRVATGPPTYIYRWSITGRPHISSSFVSQDEAYAKMIIPSDEPEGIIHLRPKLRCRYDLLVRNLLSLA